MDVFCFHMRSKRFSGAYNFPPLQHLQINWTSPPPRIVPVTVCFESLMQVMHVIMEPDQLCPHSALYVVDLKKFRKIAAGDRLRGQYQALSQDPNSLSNLDQVKMPWRLEERGLLCPRAAFLLQVLVWCLLCVFQLREGNPISGLGTSELRECRLSLVSCCDSQRTCECSVGSHLR